MSSILSTAIQAEISNRSALHQHRAGAARRLALVHDAEALGDLGIGFEQPAEIAAEAVLVHLVVGLDVPETATVGRNFVRDDNAHHVVFPETAAFHLEIDQTDADAEEQAREEVIDADRQRHDVVDFLRRGPAERGDVLFRHHRVVELILLVVEFDDRTRQLCAFLDPEPGREGTGRDIPHHHFERDDLDFANQLLAHVETADEMRRHADFVEMREYIFRDAVVEDAFALDHLVLLRVERGGVVLEVLDQSSGFRPFIKDLRLALVNAAAAAHRNVPWFEKVHRVCRGSV